MKNVTVKYLADNISVDNEEALIKLWYGGLDKIKDSNDILTGTDLRLAKKILDIPEGKHLRSKTYWKQKLNLSEKELEEFLKEYNITTNEKSTTLPKGAVKRLKVFKKLEPIIPTIIKSEVKSGIIEKKNRNNFQLKEIGHRKEIEYLNYEKIVHFHIALVEDFKKHADPIDPSGIRDEHLLKSAVFRQHTCLGDQPKYITVEMTGAALLHSLIHNHPFHNGNKRTALVSLLVFLDQNGFMFTCNEDDLFKFVLLIAQHKIQNVEEYDYADQEVFEISKWICSNSRINEKGERTIHFLRLKQILNKYNCVFEHNTAGRTMTIMRNVPYGKILGRKRALTTYLHYGGDGRDVSKSTIGKVRKDLQLDDLHGIDTKAFYDDSPVTVDSFIVDYRKTLQRLARL